MSIGADKVSGDDLASQITGLGPHKKVRFLPYAHHVAFAVAPHWHRRNV
jgi:hypothetical protein